MATAELSANAVSAAPPLTDAECDAFQRDGYLLRRGVFTAAELADITEHFRALHARGDVPGCFSVSHGVGHGGDPLAAWPRMMHPHRIDERSRQLLLDSRLFGTVAGLFGEPALAAQSMWYWKPPGARGQALHQDDFYLRTQPGECLAAWVAVDLTDQANGCLRVVPGSHRGELQCPHEADAAVSFSTHEVQVPDGASVVPVIMGAGDVLFFPGRLIHGSLPNRSTDRFRRSFICHYVPAASAACAAAYQPLLNAAGETVTVAQPGPDSDPCGGPAFDTA